MIFIQWGRGSGEFIFPIAFTSENLVSIVQQCGRGDGSRIDYSGYF